MLFLTHEVHKARFRRPCHPLFLICSGQASWAHLAHVIHESLTQCFAELPPATCESKWTSEWLLDPISYGIHKFYDDTKKGLVSVEFQIRIMDQGIMFVAVNHRAQAQGEDENVLVCASISL